MSDFARKFAEDGYCHIPKLFDSGSVARLETEFDRIVDRLAASGEQADATWPGEQTRALAAPGDRILHTHNVQRYSRVWLDALLDNRFLDAARALLGPDIILHHSKLFQKPAEHGSPFPMHQDWPYFPTRRDSMIAAIIHVSDATDEMGCLRVYPGSQRLGRVENSDGRRHQPLLDDYPIETARALPAQAGDVVFFHYFTLHGSMPNRSHTTRKTVLCQLYSGQDEVEPGNHHPDEKLVLSGFNHTMAREKAGEPG